MVSPLFRSFHRHLPDEILVAWLGREQMDDASGRVEHHLARCARCSRRAGELRVSLHELDGLFYLRAPAPDLTAQFERRLRTEIRQLAAAPRRPVWRVPTRFGWGLALSSFGLAAALVLPQAIPTMRRWGHVEVAPANPAKAKPVLPDVPAAVTKPERPADTMRKRTVYLPPRPTDAQLLAAEVDARVALHEIHACLGEQIEIVPSLGHEVLVRGVVDGDARRQEVRQALSGISWVRSNIETFEESARNRSPVVQQQTFLTAEVTAHKKGRKESALLTGIPREQSLEIARQAVAASVLSMRHAWSIRRQVDAFPKERLQQISSGDRKKLERLLEDHAAAWQGALGTLREKVGPVLSAPPAAAPTGESLSFADLFDRARELDRIVRTLFADSNASDMDPAVAAAHFYPALGSLQGVLEPDAFQAVLAGFFSGEKHQASRR